MDIPFQKTGYETINGNTQRTINNQTLNPCLVLNCYITYSWKEYVGLRVTLKLTNCNNQEVYVNSYEKHALVLPTASAFKNGVKKAYGKLEKYNYNFDDKLTPVNSKSVVEKIDVSEKELKEYFDSNKTNSLEGIYKSYQNNSMGYYKIAVKKFDNVYKAIIIESDVFNWKQGEVKAYFEPTSTNSVYSTTWYSANKTKEESFSELDKSILSVEIPASNGANMDIKFIKTYPISKFESKSEGNQVVTSSGSGFFISTNGLIATNAHVIEGAKSIVVRITNENETTSYNAKVELKDSKNDVAILKLDDTKFKGLSSIPYTLVEKCEIGEKVFTIGYPLNNVMGTNYKLTDGIISSNTGIQDDVRYYQITVPIQPGNSGGPLFNKDGNITGITSSRLNSNAVGTNIENVNYAIKIAYLNNIINMLPAYNSSNNQNGVKGKNLSEQTKILKNYVCLIEVVE